MSLSKTGLKGRIEANLTSQGFDLSGTPWLAKLAQAVADAVVDEIQANAQVTTSGAHLWGGTGDHVHGAGTIQ